MLSTIEQYRNQVHEVSGSACWWSNAVAVTDADLKQDELDQCLIVGRNFFGAMYGIWILKP